MNGRLSRLVITGVVAGGLAIAGCGEDDASPTTTTGSETGEVVRTALADSDRPQAAPGRSLGLSRVTIPPGAKLPSHYHEGTQVAFVEEGTLTYTVEEGAVDVMSGSPEEKPKLVRTIKAGQTGEIDAGGWIVEQQTTIHHAANEGTEPIVIYLSTLLRRGAPPATLVE